MNKHLARFIHGFAWAGLTATFSGALLGIDALWKAGSVMFVVFFVLCVVAVISRKHIVPTDSEIAG